MHVVEPGKHGRGIQIKEGDRFVMPTGWIQLSFNPLKSTASFSRDGLQWLAEMVFLDKLPSKRDEFLSILQRLEEESDSFLNNSALLEGMNINNPEHSELIFQKLQEHKNTQEWWVMWEGIFTALTRQAIAEGDAEKAAWAMGCAERCRTMSLFKEHIEEVIMMGHSVKRIIDILHIWDNNKNNDNEEFWQLTFNENSYVISQVFAMPVVFIEGKAYVGGMRMDRNEARFVDYLYSAESSREAILVEIKTPETKLLGSKYRGFFAPSSELAGAIIQVMDYRAELIQNYQNITRGTKYEVSVFNPRCVIIAGNGNQQLISDERRRSFEMFRTGLKDVEIITYDELFRKVEVLGSLFGLIRKNKEST